MPYFEEYSTCGCVSGWVSNPKNLMGYCKKHGSDVRAIYRGDKNHSVAVKTVDVATSFKLEYKATDADNA